MDSTERDILCAYDNLAKAIVYQAMKDYAKSYRANIKNTPEKTKCYLSELQRFFTSEWYSALFNYDGKDLMKCIEKSCESNKSFKNFIQH